MVAALFRTVRHLAMFMVMGVIWLVLVMTYFDKFPLFFGFIRSWLMPWKQLFEGPAGSGMQGRLDFLEFILDSSRFVANAGFVVMVMSFVMLGAYATYVYQQRQRRMRENDLLVIKNREIERRKEFIRYISATIGHEFKNNLGRIKRRLDFIDLPPAASQRIYRNFEKLFADIDIFKQISDESEAGLIDFERLDLYGMLESLREQYSDIADITFLCEIKPPDIFASKPLLRTVFENLLDNAVKYKKPTQEKAQVMVTCSMDLDGRRKYVSIHVRDQGIGMDEERADSCFYEGRSTSDGWGRGMYFAKYVVGLHAGKIRVGKEHTTQGEGSEIIINLPFVEESIDI